jgi:4-hydroxy-3-methylbut-2-enyl diphosphate reductase
MEINIAKGIGFCYGVKRALQLAKQSANNGGASCLGAIIHNEKVIEELEKEGIHTIRSIEELKTEKVIVRTHGLPPDVLKDIEKRGKIIIDGTCPFVKRAQNLAKSLKEEGYEVIIIGDPSHPEIIGIQGYINNKGKIVLKEEEAISLPYRKKRGVISQTTQDLELFKRLVSLIAGKTYELKVFNTICSYTVNRQREAEELARKVDLMLIIGSRKSSNTTKLFEISKRILPSSYQVESSKDLNPEMFFGVKKVGIITGSSTPNSQVDEVVKKILEIDRIIKKEKDND